MISKVLLVLGPLTLAWGLWRPSDGLAAVGGTWIVAGVAAVWYSRRAQAAIDAAAEKTVSAGNFLIGTLVLLLGGVPALLIGITEWEVADAGWRWLPLVVGGVLTGVAVLSGLMYLLGSGISAASGPAPTIPGAIVIEGMEQTGVYVNNKPRIAFRLQVRPDEGAEYRVTKKATVPFTAVGGLAIGKGFRATVAGPEDPTNMDIDWSAPVAAEPVEGLSDRLAELEELRSKGLVSQAEYDVQRRRLLDSL